MTLPRQPDAAEPGPNVASSRHQSHEFFYELVSESDAAEQAGNLVRAAIQDLSQVFRDGHYFQGGSPISFSIRPT